VNHDSSATNNHEYHGQGNHVGTESRTSRSSSVSLNRQDSSIDFPLDGLPGAPAVATSAVDPSTLTYAQIAQRKAAAAAKLANAAANNNSNHDTVSLGTASSEHSIGNNVGPALVNHHIHKDSHSVTSNTSLRTRSIVVSPPFCIAFSHW